MLRTPQQTRRFAPRAARTVAALRVSLIALGGQPGRRTKCAVRQGRTVSLAEGGQTQDDSQDRSGILVGPPLTLLRRVQASDQNAVASCMFVRSVGKRPALPALTYAHATQLRPCSLVQSSANTPESLSHAGAFAIHIFKAAKVAPASGLVPPLTTPASGSGGQPRRWRRRHFSLVSWPWPTPPAFDLRTLQLAPVSCSPLRPPPTHQKHCLALARSPGNGPDPRK